MATKAFDVFGEIALHGAAKVKSELKSAAAEAKAASSRNGFGGLGAASLGVAAGLAAAAVAAAGFGLTAAKAAIAAEIPTARLRKTVESTGIAWGEAKKEISSTIEEQKRLAAYSGGDLKNALSALIRMTGSAADGQRTLAIATNLARAAGIDLETSAKLVGRVYNGNTGVLKRYGIAVREGASATEALAAIERTVAGQAEAYAETTEGRFELLQGRIKSIQVAVGAGITRVLSRQAGHMEIAYRKGMTAVQRQAALEKYWTREYLKGGALRRNEAYAVLQNTLRMTDAEIEASKRSVLAESRKTAASRRRADALMLERTRLLELREAEYAAESADINAERAKLALADATKAMLKADKEEWASKRKAAKATRDHGKSSREARQAHREYRHAARSAKDATLDYRQAVLEAKHAQDVLTENGKPTRKSLSATEKAFRRTAAKAEEYIRKLQAWSLWGGDLPGNAPVARHGGGAITRSGLYSLRAGEYVLKRTAAEALNSAAPTTGAAAQPNVTVLVDLGDGLRRMLTKQVRGGTYRSVMAGA